ncbi:hypothetical protein FB451DRAFT_1233074 [Mycena latifolia]|nr:hypothetical protein FB451DRAFT_1233074 [Mycena latifolia]
MSGTGQGARNPTFVAEDGPAPSPYMQNTELQNERGKVVPESTEYTQCLKKVLSTCGLTPNAKDITILREGKHMGRQAVFAIARTWVIRIFELHDGYRQPAAFIAYILTALEEAGAPCEHIRYHGVVPDTPFHYTVSKFVEGAPLTDGLCWDSNVRRQVAALYRDMWRLDVPDAAGTVEDYMRPRLERLHTKLSAVSPPIFLKVGVLSSLSDLRAFRMVVSHCDLVPENIIARFEPSVSVSIIDWEFCAYVPEYRVAVQLGSKNGRETWGAGFLQDCGYGPYPEQVRWTEALCMIAEDWDSIPEFEAQILIALEAR